MRVDKNPKVNPMTIQKIHDECKKNIMIDTQVKPKLERDNGEKKVKLFRDTDLIELPKFDKNFNGYIVRKLKVENAVY